MLLLISHIVQLYALPPDARPACAFVALSRAYIAVTTRGEILGRACSLRYAVSNLALLIIA